MEDRILLIATILILLFQVVESDIFVRKIKSESDSNAYHRYFVASSASMLALVLFWILAQLYIRPTSPYYFDAVPGLMFLGSALLFIAISGYAVLHSHGPDWDLSWPLKAWTVGGLAGVILIGTVATNFHLTATISIFFGAIAAAAVGFFWPTKSNFAATEAAYFLGSATLFLFLEPPTIPEVYSQDVFVGLVIFGSVTAFVALTRWAIGKSLVAVLEGYTDPKNATLVWEFVSAVAGLILIIWTVFTVNEKLVRYGGSAGAGSLTFALDLVGVELPIPIWFLQGVDASVVVFAGSVAVGFHVLDTLYTGWYLARATAKGTVKADKKALSVGASAVSSAGKTVTNSDAVDLSDAIPRHTSGADEQSMYRDDHSHVGSSTSVEPKVLAKNIGKDGIAVLDALEVNSPLTIEELAAAVETDVYAVSQTVAGLEDADLVSVDDGSVAPVADEISFDSFKFQD